MTIQPGTGGGNCIRGPICQSCGGLLTSATDRGTEVDGTPSSEYCGLCYTLGRFRADFSMDEMVQVSAARLSWATGMPICRAQAVLSGTLPRLSRWQPAA